MLTLAVLEVHKIKDSFAAGEKINEFVQGFVDGKLEQKLRSEDTPEAQVCVAATSMLVSCSYVWHQIDMPPLQPMAVTIPTWMLMPLSLYNHLLTFLPSP